MSNVRITTPEKFYRFASNLAAVFTDQLTQKYFSSSQQSIDWKAEQSALLTPMSLYKSLRITSDFLLRWDPNRPIPLEPVNIGEELKLEACQTANDQITFLSITGERNTKLAIGQNPEEKIDLDDLRHSALIGGLLIPKRDEGIYPVLVNIMLQRLLDKDTPLSLKDMSNPDKVIEKILRFMWAVPEPDAASHPAALGVVRRDRIKITESKKLITIQMTPTTACEHLTKLENAIHSVVQSILPEGWEVSVSSLRSRPEIEANHIFARLEERNNLERIVRTANGNPEYFRQNFGYMMEGGVIPGKFFTPGATAQPLPVPVG